MTKIMNDQRSATLYPNLPIPSVGLYMRWGEKKIRYLVRYHHYLLRLHDENFLPKDEKHFDFVTQKIADYFVETFSNGQFTRSTHQFPAFKMRYFQKTLDESDRDLWLELYKKAILDCKMPSEYIEEFWNWIEVLSLWTVNANTVSVLPRYPYHTIWTQFTEIKPMHRCG